MQPYNRLFVQPSPAHSFYTPQKWKSGKIIVHFLALTGIDSIAHTYQ
jgi:hypothetical protein